MHRVNNIQQTETRSRRKQQDDGMQDRSAQQDIAGPIVQPKLIEMPVRPVTHGAGSQRNHQTQQQIHGDQAHGHQADVRGKVDRRNHRRISPRTSVRIAG